MQSRSVNDNTDEKNDNNVTTINCKGTSTCNNQAEHNKSRKEVLSPNQNVKGIDQPSQDPRRSHDLKQKVRQVRFFLPFSRDYRERQIVQKTSERNSNTEAKKDLHNVTRTIVEDKQHRDTEQSETQIQNLLPTSCLDNEPEAVKVNPERNNHKETELPRNEKDDKIVTGSVSGVSIPVSTTHTVRGKSATSAVISQSAEVKVWQSHWLLI